MNTMKFLVLAGIAALLGATGSSAHAQVLFRDDFSGTTLDTSKWSVGNWQLGRTQLGKTPVIAGGFARMTLETFNPRNAGHSFLGTEIDTKTPFSVGEGVEFEARVRVNRSSEGLVTSFFTYSARDVNGESLSDEIDFEFLSKQTHKAPFSSTSTQLTTYRGFNNTLLNYDDPAQSNTQNVRVAGLNLSRFNTFLIRWLPDRVEWLVNGQLIKTSFAAVPEQDMRMCLNFWAPDSKWDEAFSSLLLPAPSKLKMRAAFYDVDYVEVRRTVSAPSS